jgi:hypothetical protein
MNKVGNTALLFTKLVLAAAFILLMGVISIVTAPAIEGHLFPVVSNMQFVKDGEFYTVYGEKNRACEFLSLQGLVRTKNGIEKAEFTFDETADPTSRPIGKQSFGKWRIQPPGEVISIYSTHRCHFLWDTSTTLIKNTDALNKK